MNNEKMNQMINEAYEKYCKIAGKVEEPDYDIHVDDPNQNCTRLMTKEEFINKCKINPEFSERWGLKIEERELSWKERTELLKDRSDFKRDFYDRNGRLIIEEKIVLDESNIPTKLITITYNNETIESYE